MKRARMGSFPPRGFLLLLRKLVSSSFALKPEPPRASSARALIFRCLRNNRVMTLFFPILLSMAKTSLKTLNKSVVTSFIPTPKRIVLFVITSRAAPSIPARSTAQDRVIVLLLKTNSFALPTRSAISSLLSPWARIPRKFICKAFPPLSPPTCRSKCCTL